MDSTFEESFQTFIDFNLKFCINTFKRYRLFLYFLWFSFLVFIIVVPFMKKLWKGKSKLSKSASLKTEETHEAPSEDHFDEWNCKFIPYIWKRLDDEEMLRKSEEFYKLMNRRRTVRFFSNEPISEKVIEFIIKTAGTSPSGAHKQPWTFVVVSSKSIKLELRQIVEAEEQMNYERRMSKEWVNSLKVFKTDWHKSYIEDAPYVILVFKQIYSFNPDGSKMNHYYVEQSLSLAVGILITAIHNCGLATLTSTPLNCGPAISSLLQRPRNEKLVYLLPVGFPAKDCTIPDIVRKSQEEIAIYI